MKYVKRLQSEPFKDLNSFCIVPVNSRKTDEAGGAISGSSKSHRKEDNVVGDEEKHEENTKSL